MQQASPLCNRSDFVDAVHSREACGVGKRRTSVFLAMRAEIAKANGNLKLAQELHQELGNTTISLFFDDNEPDWMVGLGERCPLGGTCSPNRVVGSPIESQHDVSRTGKMGAVLYFKAFSPATHRPSSYRLNRSGQVLFR